MTTKEKITKERKRIKELHSDLLKSELNLFPRKGKVHKSDKQGVYIIYSPDKTVLHVGKTNRGIEGLNQRLDNHRTGSSSFRNNYLKKNELHLKDGYKFKFLEVEDSRERALLEALTAGLLCPIYIGTGEKR